jgi:hypothetical protein
LAPGPFFCRHAWRPGMRALCLAATLLWLAAPASAAERVALFPFELVNTGMLPIQAEEMARLERAEELTRERLAQAGLDLADLQPLSEEIAVRSFKDCNGCDVRLARQVNAQLVAVGWVQKVSNLILNINLYLRDARTGDVLVLGSVDIRGNTDESWRRGTEYLLKHRILPALGPVARQSRKARLTFRAYSHPTTESRPDTCRRTVEARSARVRLQPARRAPVRLAPPSHARVKSVPCRTASCSLANSRSAQASFASVRSAPCICAERNEVRVIPID